MWQQLKLAVIIKIGFLVCQFSVGLSWRDVSDPGGND